MSNRAFAGNSAILVGLLLLTARPAFPNIEMSHIAAFPGNLAGTLPCGDVYHDGHMALVGSGDGIMVYEDTGGNSFSVRQYRLNPPGQAYAHAVGDWDSDGLTDMVTSNGGMLDVWEALTPDTFPTQKVFSDTDPSHYPLQSAQFCDLDRDGLKNLLASRDGAEVWEVRGDNQYVITPYAHGWWTPDKFPAVADFDRDSLMEFGGATALGWLTFFECRGSDSYVETCSIPSPPGQHWDVPVGCAAAYNMGGDSVWEFISGHIGYSQQSGLCLVQIFREPVHNQFVRVCTLCTPYVDWYGGNLVAGNIDGDGRDEFALSTGLDVRLYKCTGPSQYQLECQVDRPHAWVIRLFDLNQDGRDELIFNTTTSGADSTYIYEDTSGLVAVNEFSRLPAPRAVSVQPTIARLGALALFSDIPLGAAVEIHGLDGRLVSRASGVRQSSWTWDLRDQAGNLVPAGTYFAVIRSKGKATSLKLCVVK
jgi:hypothetical protein